MQFLGDNFQIEGYAISTLRNTSKVPSLYLLCQVCELESRGKMLKMATNPVDKNVRSVS